MSFTADPDHEDEMSQYDVDAADTADTADKWSLLSDLCIRIEEMINSTNGLVLVEELSNELNELVGKL